MELRSPASDPSRPRTSFFSSLCGKARRRIILSAGVLFVILPQLPRRNPENKGAFFGLSFLPEEEPPFRETSTSCRKCPVPDHSFPPPTDTLPAFIVSASSRSEATSDYSSQAPNNRSYFPYSPTLQQLERIRAQRNTLTFLPREFLRFRYPKLIAFRESS